MTRADGATIRIGVAGWDYPDWVGPVYPACERRGLDRLAYVSRFHDVVEINSTFYRPVAARAAESWLRRTGFRGEAFRFAAKAHRSWSHEPDTPPEAALAAGLDGLRPLHDAGKLCALLVQFPQSFHCTPQAFARRARQLEPLADPGCPTCWVYSGNNGLYVSAGSGPLTVTLTSSDLAVAGLTTLTQTTTSPVTVTIPVNSEYNSTDTLQLDPVGGGTVTTSATAPGFSSGAQSVTVDP